MQRTSNLIRFICLFLMLLLLPLSLACAAAAPAPESYAQTLAQLCSRSRVAGTQGEQEAVNEIALALQACGCEVTLQPFPFNESGVQATNVIAVKKANLSPTGDILIVSAHHDTKESTVGACDDGSGTAMVLELARALQHVDSDTEIRFVTFSAEEAGLKGSSYYVAGLSDEEKSRIVGDIQIDMIGHYLINETRLYTTSAGETLLGSLLNKHAQALTGSAWQTALEAASDHASFAFGGIPSVLVMQNGVGAENHRFSDAPPIVDAQKAAQVGRVLEQTLLEIADPATPSLLAASRALFIQNAAPAITEQTPILFGGVKNEVEVKAGCNGVFEKDTVDQDSGWNLAHYVTYATWFDWETPLATDFVYRKLDDGSLFLRNLSIRTQPLQLTADELADTLTAHCGAPTVYDDGTTIWGSDNVAENLSLRQYQIAEQDGEQVILVLEGFHAQEGADLRSFDFATDPQTYADTCSAADMAVLAAMHKIIPADDPYISHIISWTDGYSRILGMCGAVDPKVGMQFDIRIDTYDVTNAAGQIVDEGKMLATMVHEYGHALTRNADQIDTARLTDFPNYNDPALYKDGSYLQAYHAAFYADGKARSYTDYPCDAVDSYAGLSGISEDIAETFMVFVTSAKPEGDTIADQKVRFFYDYPELVALRAYIRGNFGYPQE